ncbi:DUF7619 domain-containing protein [Taibaiella koreensis]|uniref:DUF7619 domain-containing protein n=1 Tax=Taibaiella koreensis TaxID=1268548 RepID=UPI000E59E7EE|nr:T9SS type A sorting domain-containing protein [Taibaiella koreensis]
MNKKLLFFLLCLLALGRFAQAQSVSLVLTQAPCNANGIVTANFSGLVSPLLVSWHIIGGPSITHSNVSGPSDVLNSYAGEPFTLLVQDANGAIADAYFPGAPPFLISVNIVDGICPAPGSATATISGGTAPFAYEWTPQGSTTVVSTVNPASLPEGNYNLKVTDANGCTFTLNDSLAVHPEAPFNYTVNGTVASCTNGTATVTGITGSGTPPYSYLWSNGATTPGITGLSQGSYNVIVTDANGCARQRFRQVTQSPFITANVTPTNPTCTQNNGALMTFGAGGTPPYTYLYSNGGTTQGQNGLAPGAYVVTITDANGCTGQAFPYLSATTPVNVTYSTVPSSCTTPNGSATLVASGGQAPYTVSWNTFPAQTGLTASNLAPGSYGFTVTDANGCVRTGTVEIPPVNTIIANLTGTSASCLAANGTASTVPSGGTSPYTYLWSNGATTQNLTSLPAGNYSVTITDAAGCKVTKNWNVEASSPVNAGLASVPASCRYTADGSIGTSVWGGTAPYTYSWSNGQTGATATGLLQGDYWLHVTDANGCIANKFSHVGYSNGNACYCTVTGTVFHDLNNNCVKDPGEAGIANIQIHCAGFGYTYTDANGQYTFQLPTGTYTLSESVQGMYPLAACQNNTIPVTVTAAAGCTQTFDFANTVNPIHDIHISTWNSNFAVPGNNYQQLCIISNDGTVPESSILSTYLNDGQLNAASFSPAGIFAPLSGRYYSTAGNTFPALAPGSAQPFHIGYSVPTNIPMGTSLLFSDTAVASGPLSNWLNDYSPWNNVGVLNTTVVSSYDPNFMEVNPKGVGPEGNITRADSVLEYMVHFQNLGTYKAQKVVVVAMLDPNLNFSSLRPVYSSHKGNVTINEQGELRYTFDNINLPAKMYDEVGSNGMFTFTIKQKPNLPLGTKIKNKAGIYFDYNEPVITNEVVNTLYKPTGIEEENEKKQLSFVLYPNPANTAFTVIVENNTANADTRLNITDASGRVLLAKSMRLQSGKQMIGMNTASLSAGVYFVQLDIAGRKHTQKLVVVK